MHKSRNASKHIKKTIENSKKTEDSGILSLKESGVGITLHRERNNMEAKFCLQLKEKLQILL